jgi:hypothetical protein
MHVLIGVWGTLYRDETLGGYPWLGQTLTQEAAQPAQVLNTVVTLTLLPQLNYSHYEC